MINPPFLHPTTDFKAGKDVVLQTMSTVMVVVVLRHGPGVGDGKWINSIEAEFILVAVVALQKL